jgi:magnesium-transporting ATPase (P-type)
LPPKMVEDLQAALEQLKLMVGDGVADVPEEAV